MEEVARQGIMDVLGEIPDLCAFGYSDFSSIRIDFTMEKPQEGCFPCSVGADKADALARLDLEIDPTE